MRSTKNLAGRGNAVKLIGYTATICMLLVIPMLHAGTAAETSTRIAALVDAQEGVEPSLKSLIKNVLLPYSVDPVFTEAVIAQNAESMTIESIKATDREWVDAEDVLPIHTKLLNNACARKAREIAEAQEVIGEIFVMDNQGANVGQNTLTSDYWQGDEDKWKVAYADGKGGVFIGKPQFDRSAGIVDRKVSLPIIDADGSVIGAICYGVVTSGS